MSLTKIQIVNQRFDCLLNLTATFLHGQFLSIWRLKRNYSIIGRFYSQLEPFASEKLIVNTYTLTSTSFNEYVKLFPISTYAKNKNNNFGKFPIYLLK